MHHPPPLEPTDLLRLHGRLLDGDVDAGEALATFLLRTCPRSVRRRLPRVDPAAVEDSVAWAVEFYLGNPGSFDPAKGRLQSFIERAALRNGIDQNRSEGAQNTA